MAMRRRRFQRRMKRRVAWANGDYEVQIASDGSITALVLFDPSATDPTIETQGNARVKVRRMLIRGGIQCLPANATTNGADAAGLHMIIAKMDAEDTDDDLFGVGIQTEQRILYRDCFPFIAGDYDFGIQGVPNQDNVFRIDVDQKLNEWTGADELIVALFRTDQNVSTRMTLFWNAYIGMLFEPL